MVALVAVFLLAMSAMLYYLAGILSDETKYRSFFKKYTAYFGINIDKIQPNPAIPDPMKPHVQQAKLTALLFKVLAIFIAAVALFLLSLSFS